MNNKVIIRNVLCVLISAVLGVWLVCMYRADTKKAEAKTAALEAAAAEAYPYEQEVRQLKSDIRSLQNGVSYASERAEIMVGFVPENAEDISYIRDKSEEYGFLPVIVLDCTDDMETIKGILAEADSSWEIMLYVKDFSEETNEDVLAVMDYLAEIEREHTGVFFIRNDYRSTANVERIKADGFIGYTTYNSESPKSGQLNDGTVYFNYSFIDSASVSVGTRLAACYANRASIIVVVDMASLNQGKPSEEYAKSLFDTLRQYANYDNCTFATVADVVDELSGINAVEEDNTADYESRAAEMQMRIDELEEVIRGIYAEAEY